jgi:hypothetical protein
MGSRGASVAAHGGGDNQAPAADKTPALAEV